MDLRQVLVRDARLGFAYRADEINEIELRGRLTKRWGRSRQVTFCLLRDVSDDIQIVVEADVIGPEIANAFHEMPLGSGIAIRGTMGLSRNGKVSFFPTAEPRHLRGLSPTDLLREDTSGVATQILLARLESLARDSLKKRGFTELTPRYLSSTWPDGGLQALQVRFGGQSIVPLYLAVSPVAQIVRSVLAVGETNFFMISRTFATNFLATQNGAEAIVAASIDIDAEFEAARDATLVLVQRLLNAPNTGTSPEFRDPWLTEPTLSVGPTLNPNTNPTGLHLHYTEGPLSLSGPGGFEVGRAYQVHWRSDLTLADGYELQIANELTALVCVVYLERCLRLMRAQENLRIRDVSRPHTPESVEEDEDSAS